MKGISKATIYTICLSMLLALCLSGCGDKSGSTIDEPEITSEYLTEDYTQQLITDGAEVLTGYISILEEESAYSINIDEQEVVPSSSYEEGYYIADTNIQKSVSLSSGTRIVCEVNDNPEIVTSDDFISEDRHDELYTVYIMGKSAELIIETEPGSLIE